MKKARPAWKRILIAEDDPSVKALSASARQSARYKVRTADSVDGAKRIFDDADGNFDLLLSDIILPDKKGTDLARSILKKKPGHPIILCGGYSGDLFRDISEEGNQVIEKPFSVATLLKKNLPDPAEQCLRKSTPHLQEAVFRYK